MKRKIYIGIFLILTLILNLTPKSNAMYQSKPTGNRQTDTATNWVRNIRKMESNNYGMGLTETINVTTLEAISESNNIDVHLQKNTEYGAAILLGSSQYGKQGQNNTNSSTSRYMDKGEKTTSGTNATNLATSTGNVYGIYELGYSWEWTAGGTSSFLPYIASRYVDRYTTEQVGKAGDATIEGSVNFSKWHTTNPRSNWVTGSYGFLRGGGNVGVFSRNVNDASVSYDARAAVVCGVGL